MNSRQLRLLYEYVFLVLILIVVGLLLAEVVIGELPPWTRTLELSIILVFFIEYVVKLWLAENKILYVLSPSAIIDLLTIMPALSLTRMGKFMGAGLSRMLKLLRVVRIIKISNYRHEILSKHRRLASFLTGNRFAKIFLFTLTVWVLGSAFMAIVEPDWSLADSFWRTIVYTMSGVEEYTPQTTAGKCMSVIIMVIGVGIIGLLTGTIASVLIEESLLSGQGLKRIKLSGHIVIIGWGSKTEEIIRELHSPEVKRKVPIVVISDTVTRVIFPDDDEFRDVYFVKGAATSEDVLQRAAVGAAVTAIVLAEPESGREESDARSVLTALAIEALNPAVYTIVEVCDQSNIANFSYTTVDEVVCAAEFSERLLSQVIMNPGITRVFDELLTFERGNEVYLMPLPQETVGMTFRELHRRLLQSRVILVGVESGEPGKRKISLNPGADTFRFRLTDKAVVIAFDQELPKTV